MTTFDPIRSLREEIAGLNEIGITITKMTSRAEMELGEAEERLNSLRRLQGFAAAELDRKRQVLHQLEEKQA